MMKIKHILSVTIVSAVLASCGSGAVAPDSIATEAPVMNPDYAGVTFPVNIAAPSFRIVADSTCTV